MKTWFLLSCNLRLILMIGHPIITCLSDPAEFSVYEKGAYRSLPVTLLTYRRFPLSNLAYTLITIHAMILMEGGHYSYAKVPLGFWMENWFGWTRNNYDKIGHFMQGFGPAIYTREIMARTSPLKRGRWLAFVSIAVPLAFSALYEILEWAASLTSPADTEAFLGTQGDVWDTQTDDSYLERFGVA